MPQYQGRKKCVFLILSQLPMDQCTHKWLGLYDPGFVNLLVETLVLDPRLGGYLEFETVHEEKVVSLQTQSILQCPHFPHCGHVPCFYIGIWPQRAVCQVPCVVFFLVSMGYLVLVLEDGGLYLVFFAGVFCWFFCPLILGFLTSIA
jgi:hypothetical protein